MFVQSQLIEIAHNEAGKACRAVPDISFLSSGTADLLLTSVRLGIATPRLRSPSPRLAIFSGMCVVRFMYPPRHPGVAKQSLNAFHPGLGMLSYFRVIGQYLVDQLYFLLLHIDCKLYGRHCFELRHQGGATLFEYFQLIPFAGAGSFHHLAGKLGNRLKCGDFFRAAHRTHALLKSVAAISEPDETEGMD